MLGERNKKKKRQTERHEKDTSKDCSVSVGANAEKADKEVNSKRRNNKKK